MLKSLITALALGAFTMTGSAGLAHYQPRKQCAMTITKGGCPIWIPAPQPGPTLPKPPSK